MIRRQHIISLLLLSLMLVSCEDIITLNLDKSESKVVIEATLDAGSGEMVLLLSRSNEFYEIPEPVYIQGAAITLTGIAGESYTLSESQPGRYGVSGVNAISGNNYTINIISEGSTFTATSVVPYPAVLDTVITQTRNLPFGQGSSVSLSVRWFDPAGSDNYYRLRFARNDTVIVEPFVLVNDKYLDGSYLSVPVPARFVPGDSVVLNLVSSDKNYYNYFVQLWAVAGGGANSTTPFNPVGNFGKDVLGYFGIVYNSEIRLKL